jgi:hypothetical protein
MLGGAFEDTSLPWDTQARMLDNLMVAMAGSSAERQVLGEDGLPHMYLTDEWKSKTLARIQELVADARVRADAIIAEHQDALIVGHLGRSDQSRLVDGVRADPPQGAHQAKDGSNLGSHRPGSRPRSVSRCRPSASAFTSSLVARSFSARSNRARSSDQEGSACSRRKAA